MDEINLTTKDKDDLINYLESYREKISEDDINEINRKFEKKAKIILNKKNIPSYVKKMIKTAKILKKALDTNKINKYSNDIIIAALHYLILAEDKIPDYIPAVGYLDDAYVISIAYNKIKKEI